MSVFCSCWTGPSLFHKLELDTRLWILYDDLRESWKINHFGFESLADSTLRVDLKETIVTCNLLAPEPSSVSMVITPQLQFFRLLTWIHFFLMCSILLVEAGNEILSSFVFFLFLQQVVAERIKYWKIDACAQRGRETFLFLYFHPRE